MAIRNDFAPGEVLAAADLNDTFGSKLNIAGGKILQIVRATDSTTRSTTSTSLVDVTGMSVTISPQKTDSTLILLFSLYLGAEWTGGGGAAGDRRVECQIADSSNNPLPGSQGQHGIVNLVDAVTTTATQQFCQLIGISTPSTTSAVTYKMRFRVVNATTTGLVLNAGAQAQMFAIEVSA
jgi:hypothetical protein